MDLSIEVLTNLAKVSNREKKLTPTGTMHLFTELAPSFLKLERRVP